MVVDKIVDELVWHYPAIVLGKRGQRSADMALQLAGAVARILELAPTYQGSASFPFRGTERSFDKAFIQKHARLCTELLDKEPSESLHQESLARVHAAMRTIVVAGGARGHHPDDDSLIWMGIFRWGDIRDSHQVFQSLIVYMDHCLQEGDFVGLGDALLVASDLWRFGSDVQKTALLDILISSLGSGSTRLRRIAIRVAYDNRVALSATENTQHADIGVKILTTFSQALMTSISLDIASASGASDQADIDQDLANDKPNDDSDFSFHDERDECYLEVIFTVTNSSDWVPSIVKDGHLDRCLWLLLHDTSHAFYFAVIFLRVEADKRVDSARLSEISDVQWGVMTYSAWRSLRNWVTLEVCIDLLPALAERTIKYMSSDYMNLPRLRHSVVEALDQLKREGVREEIWLVVGTLIKAIDERQREESK